MYICIYIHTHAHTHTFSVLEETFCEVLPAGELSFHGWTPFFFFFWLRWVFVVACRIFIAASVIFLLQRAGFSLVMVCRFSLSSCGVWAPEHMDSVVVVHRAPGRVGSVVVMCGLSCPAACGILAP